LVHCENAPTPFYFVQTVPQLLIRKLIILLFRQVQLKIHLWIIGRNFSHFSDKEEDKRTIWFSWYKLYQVISTHYELKRNLQDLSIYLRKNSLQSISMPKIENQELQLGRNKIVAQV